VRDVLGSCAVVQRCQVRKKRNVLEHLPENARGWGGVSPKRSVKIPD